MLRSPRVNLVESDEGFSVEVLGRTGILYKEGDHVMFVDSEVLARSGIAVWRNRIQSWREPYQDETVDEGKRAQIIENIRHAVVEFWGSELEVVG
jgi:hypothetical protein